MDWISKRELLKEAGISYGQLYRWKRQGLLPEEWFVKRAVPSGQETFLPRAQALARIARILELKQKHSFDGISALLDERPQHTGFSSAELLEIGIDAGILRRLDEDSFSFGMATYLYLLNRAVDEDGLPVYLAAGLARSGTETAENCTGHTLVTLFRGSGGYHCVMSFGDKPPIFDASVNILSQRSAIEAEDALNAYAAKRTEEEV